MLASTPCAGVTGTASGAWGWCRQPHPDTYRKAETGECTGTQRAEPLYKALLLGNHMPWGAASNSYSFTCRKLPPLRPETRVESLGRRVHPLAPLLPSRTPGRPPHPAFSARTKGEGGHPALFLLPQSSGRGSVRIRVQPIVNLPSPCGFFLPPPSLLTRPALPS